MMCVLIHNSMILVGVCLKIGYSWLPPVKIIVIIISSIMIIITTIMFIICSSYYHDIFYWDYHDNMMKAPIYHYPHMIPIKIPHWLRSVSPR